MSIEEASDLSVAIQKDDQADTRRDKVPSGNGDNFHIVGIGASAGGVQILEQFFAAMPTTSGMAFVVVQHLDPNYESLMASLLAKETTMPVEDTKDGVVVQPGHVYLKPPGKDITIRNRTLYLKETQGGKPNRLPIDTFFRSLAEDRKERAICIVFSGASDDGTLGAKQIKGEGGMVMVQDDQQAEYKRMPRSVIEAGIADMVLPVEKMPKELLGYIKHPFLLAQEEEGEKEASEGRDQGIHSILMLVRLGTGHDFSQYKQNTIRRRINRRMALHQLTHLSDYKRYLRRSPDELDALFKDLIINVTSFFRDQDAHETLKKKALKPLISTNLPDDKLRIWVPGCATGEEAYSIAMAAFEIGEELDRYSDIKIFATDINHEAIEIARDGLFPESIVADVSEERLRRFFSKKGSYYRVDSKIRDIVVFADHDLTRDPPFSNLDLISCRNLLIYMNNDLQKKVITIFNYALKPGGFLFLGSSETVGGCKDLLTLLDKKAKVYRKRDIEPEGAILFQMPVTPGFPKIERKEISAERMPEKDRHGVRREQVRSLVERNILEKSTPPAVLLDDDSNILFFHGITRKYLSPPVGEPGFNLFDMIEGELHYRLTRAIQRVKREKKPIRMESIQVRQNDDFFSLGVVLTPILSGEYGEYLYLLEFREDEDKKSPSREKKRKEPMETDYEIASLQSKLDATRQELQATIEELETSNEELKSANEELQANNEELQSTNEELESSKEELQSTNEEMETVNSELFKKNQMLMKAEDDSDNLFNSIEIGTLFLDNKLCIKRFTPKAQEVFKLQESRDIGRPISDITSSLKGTDVGAVAEEVMDKLTRKRIKVTSQEGKTFAMRVIPYRTRENIIEGVVISFFEWPEIEPYSKDIGDNLQFLYDITSSLWEPILFLDEALKVIGANRAFYRFFRTAPSEILNRPVLELGDKRWNIPELEKFLLEIVPMDEDFEGYEVEHDFPGIGHKTLLLSAKKIRREQETLPMTLLIFRESDPRDTA